MIEILCLIAFYRKLASIAGDKGRSSAWGVLGVLCWIGGEFGGAVMAVMQGMTGGSVYLMAILGAAVGALVAYVCVSALPSRRVDSPQLEEVFQ